MKDIDSIEPRRRQYRQYKKEILTLCRPIYEKCKNPRYS